jgi:hypothetical protein
LTRTRREVGDDAMKSTMRKGTQGFNAIKNKHQRLDSYGQALKCRELKEREGLTAAQVGEREGLSGSHAGNLIRALENLDPRILQAWSRGDLRATTTTLFRLAKMPRAKQLAGWNAGGA